MEKAIVLLAHIKGERTGEDPVLQEKKKGMTATSQSPQLFAALAAHQYSASTGNVHVFILVYFKKPRH